MARVELPKPFRRLLLWTWYRIPRSFAPSMLLTQDEGARPNGIAERAIEGAEPRQLKAAFLDLLALTQQHERSVHVVADEAACEADAANSSAAAPMALVRLPGATGSQPLPTISEFGALPPHAQAHKVSSGADPDVTFTAEPPSGRTSRGRVAVRTVPRLR